VTDAAGTTKCKFKASLVGLIESLWVNDRPHGIVDVINSSSSHYGLQTARLWDSHGSSDNMPCLVYNLGSKQGPHNRHDMRERNRPSRYLHGSGGPPSRSPSTIERVVERSLYGTHERLYDVPSFRPITIPLIHHSLQP
jgi:hypothetical protein